MTMQITDPVGAAGRIQVSIAHLGAVEIPYEDAQIALEDLARILGFTLIDHVERRSLIELTEEVQNSRGPGRAQAVAQAGIALANAVADALRISEEDGR